MINSFQQCLEIQKRRVAAGKRGYSKAVRRFLRATAKIEGNEDESYKVLIAQMPVNWEKKEEAVDDEE